MVTFLLYSSNPSWDWFLIPLPVICSSKFKCHHPFKTWICLTRLNEIPTLIVANIILIVSPSLLGNALSSPDIILINSDLFCSSPVRITYLATFRAFVVFIAASWHIPPSSSVTLYLSYVLFERRFWKLFGDFRLNSRYPCNSKASAIGIIPDFNHLEWIKTIPTDLLIHSITVSNLLANRFRFSLAKNCLQ